MTTTERKCSRCSHPVPPERRRDALYCTQSCRDKDRNERRYRPTSPAPALSGETAQARLLAGLIQAKRRELGLPALHEDARLAFYALALAHHNAADISQAETFVATVMGQDIGELNLAEAEPFKSTQDLRMGVGAVADPSGRLHFVVMVAPTAQPPSRESLMVQSSACPAEGQEFATHSSG